MSGGLPSYERGGDETLIRWVLLYSGSSWAVSNVVAMVGGRVYDAAKGRPS